MGQGARPSEAAITRSVGACTAHALMCQRQRAMSARHSHLWAHDLGAPIFLVTLSLAGVGWALFGTKNACERVRLPGIPPEWLH
ncbi:NADPH oxidoreductase [Pandoraea cepalis]|uniref:NADPH oxidoreductase n=1 Tax=Pandoraea cepalis TaxID=2508294 RepID=A0A5E4UM91_9BURK|nr:hypothetical protein DRB87_11510 [Pandoraea sp. XY-2]VVE00643.1 NADPH oxidoreductase [Pandoraea cepalis]